MYHSMSHAAFSYRGILRLFICLDKDTYCAPNEDIIHSIVTREPIQEKMSTGITISDHDCKACKLRQKKNP